MTTTDLLPDDETGSALKRFVTNGSDLSRPMSMDFFAIVPGRTAGECVATAVRELGFIASLEYDGESKAWTCYCTKTITPSYENVTRIESQIDLIARKFGGKADGFGSYGNATPNN